MKRLAYAGAFGVGALAFMAAAPFMTTEILASAPGQVTEVAEDVQQNLMKTGPELVGGDAEALDVSKLLKISDDDYDYTIRYDDSVSLEPLSQTSVTKMGYGHVTDINIVTTATGTYSVDALKSPHVLYPGIEVERHRKPWARGFTFWSLGGHAYHITNNAHSFTFYGRMQGGGHFSTRKGRTCFSGSGFHGCT